MICSNSYFTDIPKRNKVNSKFGFNVIISLICYIAINCLAFGVYQLLLGRIWGDSMPITISQLLTLDFPIGSANTMFGGLFLVYVALVLSAKTFKKLETSSLMFLSLSSGFIVGFMMLTIGTILDVQNETVAFILRIPTGWLRFIYVEGSFFGKLVWNFFLAIMPIFIMFLSFTARLEKLQNLEKEKAETTELEDDHSKT